MSVRFLAACFIHSPVWVRGHPTDAHAASGDIDDKQDMVADEPERVHNLDGVVDNILVISSSSESSMVRSGAQMMLQYALERED